MTLPIFSEILPRELAYLNQPCQQPIQPYAFRQFPMHHRLHLLSPTRWIVRDRALNALVTHYAAVIAALDQHILADEPGPTGAKAAGFVSKLSTFDCLFALNIAHKFFSITEQLGTLLQSATITLSAAQDSVRDVVHTLSKH